MEAKRPQSLYKESCDRSALMMSRTCCSIKGGARFTNCVLLLTGVTVEQRDSVPAPVRAADGRSRGHPSGREGLSLPKASEAVAKRALAAVASGELHHAMVARLLLAHAHGM
jgi:hypothetical protein